MMPRPLAMRSLLLLASGVLLLPRCGPGTAHGREVAAVPPSPGAVRAAGKLTYPVNDTGQSGCYSDTGPMACPPPGQPFFGQDAQVAGRAMRFADNGDGTVTDLNTGLMWQKAQGEKMSFARAQAAAATCRTGGHRDWRLPTVKELYSLVHFDGGYTPFRGRSMPYIDTKYFSFAYGDPSRGERPIDVQVVSSTMYVDTTMGGNQTVFGVNFADGRIKGYPVTHPHGGPKRFSVKYVRGQPGYGSNDLVDRGDGTVLDRATGLTWQQGDSGRGMPWEQALAYCEGLELAGKDDWRLPNAKELHSIVDYTRSPATSGTAAIDPVFSVSEVEAFYWTSTTHLDGPPDRKGQEAVYIAFGRATGLMRIPPYMRTPRLMDVHGAGAQRSDPKSGDPAAYPYGRGPQGDVIRIDNHVRCVRGGASEVAGGPVDL